MLTSRFLSTDMIGLPSTTIIIYYDIYKELFMILAACIPPNGTYISLEAFFCFL
jgi:hypothetical protein